MSINCFNNKKIKSLSLRTPSTKVEKYKIGCHYEIMMLHTKFLVKIMGLQFAKLNTHEKNLFDSFVKINSHEKN